MTQDFYVAPGEQVSQGDILRSLVVYRADSEPKTVSMRSGRNAAEVWQPDERGRFVVLPADAYPAIVLSHDCAIDKMLNAADVSREEMTPEELARRSSKTDVLVAPIRPIPATWDDGKMEQVVRGDVHHQVLLPPHESVGWLGGYVDLRWIVTYRLADLAGNERILLLNEASVALLQRRLERFFSWRDEAPEE